MSSGFRLKITRWSGEGISTLLISRISSPNLAQSPRYFDELRRIVSFIDDDVNDVHPLCKFPLPAFLCILTSTFPFQPTRIMLLNVVRDILEDGGVQKRRPFDGGRSSCGVLRIVSPPPYITFPKSRLALILNIDVYLIALEECYYLRVADGQHRLFGRSDHKFPPPSLKSPPINSKFSTIVVLGSFL